MEGVIQMVRSFFFFDSDQKKRNCSWCDTGNSRSLADRGRANLFELFTNLTRKASDVIIIECNRDGSCLKFLKPFDLLELALDVAGIFDLNLYFFNYFIVFR